MKSLRVAIFTGEFPVLSETFVMRQISGLLDQGVNVTIVAGQKGEQTVRHELFVHHRMDRLVKSVRHSTDLRGKAFSLCRFLLTSPFSERGRTLLGTVCRAALKGCFSTAMDVAERASMKEASQWLGDFDAIIAHFGPNGVRAMRLREAGLISGPIATVFHGFDMSNHRLLMKWMPSYRELFKRTELFLPISDLWRNRLVEWGAPSGKIRVLRMGVDVNKFPGVRAGKPISHPLKVLSVARLTEKKGIEYAVEGVKNSKVDVHYKIIGSGPLLKELESLASGATAGHTIEFLGKKAQQDVFAELENSDVFLLPSVTASDGDMEGVPVSIMEAMAKGVVVIATHHSGVPELVEDGKTGFLVAERNSSQIAEMLNRVVAEKESLSAIRLASRAKIEKVFNNENLDVELLEIVTALSCESRVS